MVYEDDNSSSGVTVWIFEVKAESEIYFTVRNNMGCDRLLSHNKLF